MQDLPTGTVTFLFTDLEGSTTLLERLGVGYRDVQQLHHVVLRGAIAAGEGREVSTEGDSFFAVFRSASGAIRAAVHAQRELASALWPEGAVVRVRMGLHTGEGNLGGDNYLGLDVNRAARIASAGHGGQILLSDATRALVDRELPAATRLRDLGRHRLKGLTQPERLYQVVIDGLEQEFPPPRTLDAQLNNLPVHLTRFVGRQAEIARLRELLVGARLVTLTGPGGTGKTRLAVEVATQTLAESRDGAFFVDLSAVTDPRVVPTAIQNALAAREEPGHSVMDDLVVHLRDKKLLLVLDNFEQVVEAAPAILDPLLRAAPGVTALVTSRVPLHIYGEQEYPVPPLALPDLRHLREPEAVAQSEAVALFTERATSAKPGFRLTRENAPVVAEITARLDGLPLAIELAASRIKLLSPDQLLARVEQRLPLLTTTDRNVPERQRTLRRTIEWSYELLDPAHRRFHARLAVFAGGGNLEAIGAVANPGAELGLDSFDGVGALVDYNLVRVVDTYDDEPRFAMLETVREYALERLAESGEEHEIRRRHVEYWIGFAEEASDALAGPDQAAAARRLERDQDNFRAALGWAMQSGEAERGLRLAIALGEYWRLASHAREGIRWLRDLLVLPAAAERTSLRARALTVAGGLAPWAGESEVQMESAEEAVAVYRDLGDTRGEADALALLGWAQLHGGRFAAAGARLQEARDAYIDHGDMPKAANCDQGLGLVAQLEGRLDEAREHFQQALATFKELRDPYWTAFNELLLGYLDRREDDYEAAERRFRSSLEISLEHDFMMLVTSVLYAFADLAFARGDNELALRLAGASDALREPLGDKSPAEKNSMPDVPTAARSFMDETTVTALYQEGRSMALQDAVACALEQDPT